MTVSNAGFMTDKPKILIIEDQPEVLKMMAFVLTRAGCEVQTAAPSGKRGNATGTTAGNGFDPA